MTSKTRAKLFEGDDELDLAAFTPKTGPGRAGPTPDQVKAVSEAASFRSREPGKTVPAQIVAPRDPITADHAGPGTSPRRPRTHRTGRNVQFNVKASQEVVDAFYRLSDRQGWVLGETLAHALSALERDLRERGLAEGG